MKLDPQTWNEICDENCNLPAVYEGPIISLIHLPSTTAVSLQYQISIAAQIL